MTTRQKLEIIQKTLGLTQTKLAAIFDVSFVAFNSWWSGKSSPRPKKMAAIEELYLEVTGQKMIPEELLAAKKTALHAASAKHRSVVREILSNPDIRDDFILKLTYHSNSIEGSTLTEPDTAAVLFNDVALPNKTLTEQMEARNHATAIDFVLRHVAARGEVNEALVLRLHGILMNGISDEAGLYRRHAVRLVGINLPTANYLKVPDLVPTVMAMAAKPGNDVIRASAEVHCRFEQIHPFSDGNGRIGRLIMNAMLLQANQAPAIIRQERKQFYHNILYKAQAGGDQSQLEYFLCEATLDGYKVLERQDLP